MSRPGLAILVGLLALTAVIAQFAGPSRTNPPIDPSMRLEAQAPIPAHVQATLRRACYDCHSSETRWPWYSRVAPVSWLVIHDVNEGRDLMNFSRWGTYNQFDRADMLDKACEFAKKGKMPLPAYVRIHRDAKLSSTEIEALCGWARGEADRLSGSGGHE